MEENMDIVQLRKKIVNKLEYFHLFDKMTDENYLKIKYWVAFGKKLNLDNPILFSEKIQWMKLFCRRPEFTEMVDKYCVKEYISRTIGEKYNIKTLGIWDRYEDICLKDLPEQFVLKTTHDSGGVVICNDKKFFDSKVAKKKLEESLKRNYYLSGREWPYKNVKPRIIAEEYLQNNSKEGLHDYKVWCFNGKAKYIQYISGRMDEITYEAFFDLKWNKMEFSYHNPLIKEDIPKPKQLEELVGLCNTLAKNIPFVRCDFYILEDGSIKFGEITFFPMSGLEKWTPTIMDKTFGEMINISKSV